MARWPRGGRWSCRGSIFCARSLPEGAEVVERAASRRRRGPAPACSAYDRGESGTASIERERGRGDLGGLRVEFNLGDAPRQIILRVGDGPTCAAGEPSPPRFRLTPSRLSEPGGPRSANAARLSDEPIRDFDPMRRSFLRSERAMNHGSFSS